MGSSRSCGPSAIVVLVILSALALLVLPACSGKSSTVSSPPSSATSSPYSLSTVSTSSSPSPASGSAELPTSQWERGSATLAQTVAVAQRWAAALSAEMIPGSGLYTASATFDSWSGETHAEGAAAVESAYREAAPSLDWSKRCHIMAAPGVAVYEGTLKDKSVAVYSIASTPSLDLLAVDGDKIVHEEILLDTRELPLTKARVKFYGSAPGPRDTAKVAEQVAAALGDALATSDQAALHALVAPEILFYDTGQAKGVRGWDALLAWWARVPQVKLENEQPIAGPGWAVLRWTVRQVFSTSVELVMPGATVLEVRGGKVVRMTLYYDSRVIRLQT